MVVVGFLWRIIFSYNNGPINHFFRVGRRSAGYAAAVARHSGVIIPSISVALIWLISAIIPSSITRV
jgi:ABC-type sugar transport system permease subunit